MHRLLAGAAALALLAAPAVAVADVHRYEAVDGVEAGFIRLFGSMYVLVAITGTDSSGPVSRDYVAIHGSAYETLVSAKESCERMALLALAKPGRYALVVTAHPQGTIPNVLERCKLVRND